MAQKGTGKYRNEYLREEEDFIVSNQMRHAFRETGFLIIRNLMDKEEMAQILKSLESYKDVIDKYSYKIPDSHDRGPRMMLWNYPGNDVLGLVARCEKIATTSEQLMGGDEMYHYHSKLIMKEARTGGSFEWHQDYGYWYKNGIITDELNSVFLAIDPCTKENGGLQVLVGSHKGGRVDHGFSGGQQGADAERMEYLKQIYELFDVELQPGDAVFTHSNLLHASPPNDSDHRRWALICAYNKKRNNPVKKHHCASYNPLNKVANTAIKTCTLYCNPEGKDFLSAATDVLVKAETEAK